MRQRIERFGRILKLRESDRRMEQALLAAERREEDTVLQRLDVLGNEKAKALEEFRNNGDKTLSRQEIWFQRQSIDIIEKHISESRENLNDVQGRIVKTEARLVERHRDVRMMEGYVDSLKINARKALFDAEQTELDDIAVTRYNHAAAGGMEEDSQWDPI